MVTNTQISSVHLKIDKTLKEIWKNEIYDDYTNDYLLREDSLKSDLYHHLRSKLKDSYLKYHRLRIFTEFIFPERYGLGKKKVDLAIVKVKPLKEMKEGYLLDDRVEDVVCVIELKYKDKDYKSIKDDVNKIKRYTKSGKLNNCQCYLGIICESIFKDKQVSWLHPTQDSKWAKGRVTELTAYYGCDDYFTTSIRSYTAMNVELNDMSL